MKKQYYDPRFDGAWPITEATGHQGQAYHGTLIVSPDTKDGHSIFWKLGGGEYEGVGLVIDGQLHIAFGTQATYGLAIYTEQDGGIESIFTGPGFGGAVGHEKIPHCPGLAHLDATYDMSGWQPGNVTYKGKVAFAPYGELILITWAFEGTTGRYGGIGMLRNGRLLTAYGLPADYTFGCGLYTLQADGTLKGEWAIPSYQTTFKESYGLKR